MPRIGKREKRPDKRPARVRYWMKRQLEKNKVKNLVRCCGMAKEEALKFWRRGRKKDGFGRRIGRVPAGFLV